jgi:hypothetical protein
MILDSRFLVISQKQKLASDLSSSIPCPKSFAVAQK